MTDGARAQYTGFESGFDPSDHIDQAIMATRRTVVPEHGLLLLP
jgi:acetoin utilization protein AcuC